MGRFLEYFMIIQSILSIWMNLLRRFPLISLILYQGVVLGVDVVVYNSCLVFLLYSFVFFFFNEQFCFTSFHSFSWEKWKNFPCLHFQEFFIKNVQNNDPVISLTVLTNQRQRCGGRHEAFHVWQGSAWARASSQSRAWRAHPTSPSGASA